MDTIVKEQKLVGSTDYTSFKQQVNEYLNLGWHVVPGSIVIFLTPSGQNMVAKERYFAVLEK